MSDVDTSREAVERLAGDVDDHAADCRSNVETHMDLNHPNSAKAFAKMAAHHERTAATLRALLAERDAALRDAAAWKSAAHTAGNYREEERARAETAEAERDAAIESGAEQLVLVAELRDQLDAARAEVARLREVVADAVECVEAWAAYASDYFKEKHDLAGDIARLRAALAEPTP